MEVLSYCVYFGVRVHMYAYKAAYRIGSIWGRGEDGGIEIPKSK